MNATENVKVTTVTDLGYGLLGFVCPVCGKILAAWTYNEAAPEFALCTCKKKIEEKTEMYRIHEIETSDGEHIKLLHRGFAPKFSALITENGLDDVEWHGSEDPDPLTVAKILKEAQDWLNGQK